MSSTIVVLSFPSKILIRPGVILISENKLSDVDISILNKLHSASVNDINSGKWAPNKFIECFVWVLLYSKVASVTAVWSLLRASFVFLYVKSALSLPQEK